MSSNSLAAFAASMLGVTAWLWSIAAEPGEHLLAGIGGGVAAYITVHLILAAARAQLREMAAKARADR